MENFQNHLIHTSGSHSDTNNVQPISILCVAGKIVERHTHSHFCQYLVKHDLLHPAQSGFRSHHSCKTGNAKLIDIWTTNVKSGQLNDVISVELRKAFDLVDTNILLRKLALYHCDKSSYLGLHIIYMVEPNVFNSSLPHHQQYQCHMGSQRVAS